MPIGPGSFIGVTPGAGAKLATGPTYTENGNVTQDEKVLLGEPYEATYVASWNGVSVATLNDHLFELMAPNTLQVYIRHIYIAQQGYSTTQGTVLNLARLTSGGSGGTVRTPAALDSGDAAAGSTVMTLPSTKGAEAASLHQWVMVFGATGTTALSNPDGNVLDIRFPNQGQKSFRVPSGTANGMCLKLLVAGGAGNTVTGFVEWVERPF